MQTGYFKICAGHEFGHRPNTDCLLCSEPLIYHAGAWILLNPGDEPGAALLAAICDRCAEIPYPSEAQMMDAITLAIIESGISIEVVEGTA